MTSPWSTGLCSRRGSGVTARSTRGSAPIPSSPSSPASPCRLREQPGQDGTIPYPRSDPGDPMTSIHAYDPTALNTTLRRTAAATYRGADDRRLQPAPGRSRPAPALSRLGVARPDSRSTCNSPASTPACGPSLLWAHALRQRRDQAAAPRRARRSSPASPRRSAITA